MIVSLKRADRPMVEGSSTPDHRPMDEPTIDCQHCDGRGTREIALWELSDSAEWQRVNSTVICDRHQDQLLALLARLQHWQRIIIMAL